MLVIISDLHLTDGLSGDTIEMPAFRAMRQRLRDLAYDASWRVPKYDADGKFDGYGYKPIEEMHLLLLGDILDVIRSPTWLDGAARPWGDNEKKTRITPQSPEFIERVKAINDGILEKNADSLNILKRLSEGVAGADVDLSKPHRYKGLLKLTKGGARFEGAPEQQVKVHIHYMIGNHDWFYHLPGDAYNEIRKSVVDAIGLENDSNEPFPHDPEENTASARAIRGVLKAHKVFARHGDKFDEFNYEEKATRDASSLGDAIVVELLGRFPEKVAEASKAGKFKLPPDVIHDFRELDNVKPYAVIPGWINSLLDRAGVEPSVSRQVKKIWNDVADDFLQLPFVRAHDIPWRLDVVDKLSVGLKLSEGFSLQKIGDLALKVFKKTGSTVETYYKDALTEDAYEDESVEFIVYGHTHDYETVPLSARRRQDGSILRRLYINSGTWRRVHKIGRENPDKLEFYDFNVMTYLAFFRENERGGQRFESWSGTLGVDRTSKA